MGDQLYAVMIVFLTSALLILSYIDFRSHKIPNRLTLGLFLGGLLFWIVVDGVSGVSESLGAAVVGLLLLLPLYLCGGMGAGDVKLMAAVGACLASVPDIVLTAALSVLAGGIYSVAFFTFKGDWGKLVRRYWVSLKSGVLLSAEPDDPVRTRFPFAAAMLLGLMVSLAWNKKMDLEPLASLWSFFDAWGIN